MELIGRNQYIFSTFSMSETFKKSQMSEFFDVFSGWSCKKIYLECITRQSGVALIGDF